MTSFKGRILEVKIAGRSYPVEVQNGEEEILANAMKTVQKDLVGFKNAYGKQDNQDFLAMTLFTYAMSIEHQKNTQYNPNQSELLHKMQNLEDQIDLRIS